jgi:hypothetical protein
VINRTIVSAILFASFTLLPAAPALAQGEIIITQAKANAGNVTPGDAAGFPVSLTLPGAYVLGSNLNPPANKIGIQVTSHNVDIDMNGFRLNGSNVAYYGVSSGFGESRIHDGIITSFKFDGITLNGVGTNSWVVEDMQVVNNGRHGINAPQAYYTRLLNNSVLANASNGIVCREFCHVEGNNVSDNGGIGIFLTSGTVLGNTIFSNGNLGLYDAALPDDTGFGNNTIVSNNSGGDQVNGPLPLHPNYCLTAC